MKILGAILAGGKSSRFGSDKAFARVGDAPLITHVAHSLSACDEVIVVGRAPGAFGEFGLRSVSDRGEVAGPFCGLLTALEVAIEEAFTHVFLTSCDMYGLGVSWPGMLAEHGVPVAAVFDGRWQPMCSLWRVDSLPVLLEKSAELAHLQKGPSFQSIMGVVGAVAVAPFEGWDRVVSVNTPADLPV